MPNILHLDFESFSSCDIRDVGGYRYANDPSTEILCCAVALNDEEPVLWLPYDYVLITDWYANETHEQAWCLIEEAQKPDTIVYAHNASFEIAMSDALWQKTFGFAPPQHRQWRCTAAMARRAALPHALGKLAEKLNLKHQKDKRGDTLIRTFSIPQKKPAKKWNLEPGGRITPQMAPELFREFCEYCLQDVRAEQEVARVLGPFEMQGMVLEAFFADIEINSRGLPVNLLALENAQRLIDEETARISAEFSALTGLSPNQNQALLGWLKAKGYIRDDLKAATIDEELEDFDISTSAWDDTDATGDPAAVYQALQLRKQFSYAAVKKIPKMLACAGPHDNKVRGTIIPFGAGPGRWSGSLIQPQNFKRPTLKHTEEAYRDIEAGESADIIKLLYGGPLEVVSSSIRHFIHDSRECDCWAYGGCDLCDFTGYQEHDMLDVDYNAIESRIVCWLAGQDDALEEYRNGVDRYCRMASRIFGIPEEDIQRRVKAGDAEAILMRFIGKQCILGCGYGMGSTKYGATCENLGTKVSSELSQLAVSTFRETNPKIVQFWYDTERAAKAAIQNKGQRYTVGKIQFFSMDIAGMHYLMMRLPSGRHIAYPEVSLVYETPQDVPTDAEWEAMSDAEKSFLYNDEKPIVKPARKDRGRITFYAQPQGTSIWGRVDTYGGKLVENATQGTAADVMMCGLINAERAGYKAATLIHDQILAYKEEHQTVEELVQLMTSLPAWATGLPIAAEGKVVPFYKK
jgi:DNA polymerase